MRAGFGIGCVLARNWQSSQCIQWSDERVYCSLIADEDDTSFICDKKEDKELDFSANEFGKVRQFLNDAFFK